jgi:phosphatidylinositol alpha-mannosyltransferase
MGLPALLREGMSWRDVRLRTMHTAPVRLVVPESQQLVQRGAAEA